MGGLAWGSLLIGFLLGAFLGGKVLSTVGLKSGS